MDSTYLNGNWHILKGKVKEQWGKLTDDDLEQINGRKDQLIGRLEKKYSYSEKEARRKVEEFEANQTMHLT